ncbi:MAG TPA: laccase domain-containing protein [Armatimonadota bacterium]|nr:laccase domain-containing protein [Armatimonadota bacterium]
MIQFESLACYQDVTHFITTRVGGVSLPPYDSLNLGFGTRDNPEHVLENRRRLADSINVPLGSFAVAKQVHDDRICDHYRER